MDCHGPSGAIVLQPGASQAVALSAGAIREPHSPLGATGAGAREEERGEERVESREEGSGRMLYLFLLRGGRLLPVHLLHAHHARTERQRNRDIMVGLLV